MPHAPTRLPFASLTFEDGVPEATDFEDVYFSRAGGLEETHHVFLQGTDFEAAFAARPTVNIGETGFGTGLNFLAAWARWIDMGRPGRLEFVSVEAFPLCPADLKKAHEAFPSLAPLAAQLQAAWPPPARGFHPISFENGRVRLLLLFGPARKMLPDLDAQIDLWFLDGFAPARNAAMWSDAVFDEIARLSNTGAKLATFTAAGFVRRALQARGFSVEKTPGFGRKRERIVATFQGSPAGNAHHHWLPTRIQNEGRIAIIGGGLAGQLVAQSLASRGYETRLYGAPKQEAASAVPAAILAPRFLLDDQPVADFLSASYVHAVNHPAYRDHWMPPRGLMLRPADAKDRARQKAILDALDWGPNWMEDGGDHLWLAQSGALDTKSLRQTLPTATSERVSGLSRDASGWWLGGTKHGPFDHVIVAAGMATADLLNMYGLPITARAGRTLSRAAAAFNAGETAFAGAGSLSPERQGVRHVGSSFELAGAQSEEEAKNQMANKLGSLWGDRAVPATGFWRGTRATTPDRLPLVGRLADTDIFETATRPLAVDANAALKGPLSGNGLYVLSGLGAKGHQYAPLLAEVIAAQIAGAPIPLGVKAQKSLSPLRFKVRQTVRGR